MDSDSGLEKDVLDLQKRVASLEKAVYSVNSSKTIHNFTNVQGIEQRIVENIDDIGTQDLILLVLLQNPEQSKAQIRHFLNDWGKAYGSWFEGGNFSSRLIKAGLVKKVGTSDTNEDIYSLTKKGEMQASDTISKLQ